MRRRLFFFFFVFRNFFAAAEMCDVVGEAGDEDPLSRAWTVPMLLELPQASFRPSAFGAAAVPSRFLFLRLRSGAAGGSAADEAAAALATGRKLFIFASSPFAILPVRDKGFRSSSMPAGNCNMGPNKEGTLALG
jgi:hypothetical protein